jgi:hypothetical protein
MGDADIQEDATTETEEIMQEEDINKVERITQKAIQRAIGMEDDELTEDNYQQKLLGVDFSKMEKHALTPLRNLIGKAMNYQRYADIEMYGNISTKDNDKDELHSISFAQIGTYDIPQLGNLADKPMRDQRNANLGI